MNLRSLTLTFCFLALAVGLVFVSGTAAYAGPHGTTSLQDVLNALDSETTPQSTGEMSVEWTNTAGADTQYSDSAGDLSTRVDTGFDMLFRNFSDARNGVSDGSDGQMTVSAGDTVVYSAVVTNKGNNANPVPYNLKHLFSDTSSTDGSDTLANPRVSNDTFVLELFYSKSADSSATAFDTSQVGSGIYRADASDSVLQVFESDTFTLFAHITVKSSASRTDQLSHDLWLTDNAPIGNGASGTSGDQWRYDEGPTATGGDGRDTNARLLFTDVAGPKLEISKSFSTERQQAGEFRPGDTIQYTITVENTGTDTASNVAVFEAIPSSTTMVDSGTDGFVIGDDVKLVNSGSLTIGSIAADNSLTGDFSDNETQPENAARVKVQLSEVGPSSQSNSKADVRFWVTID